MDLFDILYFICNNAMLIIAIPIAYWTWQIKKQNDDIKIREEAIIKERTMQKESLQMAVQKYREENNRTVELQNLIERIKKDNAGLRSATLKRQKEMEAENARLRSTTLRLQQEMEDEKRRYRQASQLSTPVYEKRPDKNDVILDYIEKTGKIIGSIALAFMVGKALK